MATQYDFSIDQGSDVVVPFLFKDSTGTALDLTDYKARMQMRTFYTSKDVVDSLTTENGRITISGGTISLTFPHETTEAYSPKSYLYDIEIIDTAGLVTRVLQGTITVSAEVTR